MEDLNDPLQLGENYRKLSGLLVQAGDNSKAIEYIEKTIGILENLPPSKQLAMAYCSQSYTYIATEKPYLSIEWGEKALKLAKELNEPQIEIHALRNIGVGKMYVNEDGGETTLIKSLSLAQQKGFDSQALTILESLGATATINLIKQQMRDCGIKKIPKGPRQSTKENPAGLTTRQLDVLNLVTNGLPNSEIANKLFISPKTVDHHISAILSKLGVHSRTQAVAAASELSILSTK